MLDSKYWVWLQILFGFGTIRSHEIMEEYASPQELYERLQSEGFANSFLKKAEKIVFSKSMEIAEHIVEVTLKKSCYIITPDHENYPPMLHHIYGKPAAIYSRGNLNFLKDSLTFAMVGARQTSQYGVKSARFIAENLAISGCNVVSGLARGIDSVCLETALENGGNTVGVLACGLDYDYPKDSGKLKRKIVENGAVISEYPMGTVPKPYMFPARNRIMAGMSNGVIVIEAGDTSGALVTARHGFDNNREVFVVPGEIFSGTFLGAHNLIKEGIGKLINNTGDIFAEFPHYKREKSNDEKEIKRRQPNEKKATVPQGMEKIVYKIYDVIDNSYQTTDQIAQIINEDISEVLGAVTTLELLGLIVSRPGGFFTLP